MVYEHMNTQMHSVHERKMGQPQPNTANCLLTRSDYQHATQAIWIKRIILSLKAHLVKSPLRRCFLHSDLLSKIIIQMRARMSCTQLDLYNDGVYAEARQNASHFYLLFCVRFCLTHLIFVDIYLCDTHFLVNSC